MEKGASPLTCKRNRERSRIKFDGQKRKGEDGRIRRCLKCSAQRGLLTRTLRGITLKAKICQEKNDSEKKEISRARQGRHLSSLQTILRLQGGWNSKKKGAFGLGAGGAKQNQGSLQPRQKESRLVEERKSHRRPRNLTVSGWGPPRGETWV